MSALTTATKSLSVAALLALALAGCGGGGADGSTAAAPTTGGGGTTTPPGGGGGGTTTPPGGGGGTTTPPGGGGGTTTPPTTTLPPPAAPGTAMAIASVADEKAAYAKWGWTWAPSKDPALVTDPIRNFSVGSGNDIHNETEGDDLWTYLMMYRRSGPPGGTGNTVYLNRANAWATYFKSGGYRADLGAGGSPDSGFEWDHMYGWGLLAWYQHTCEVGTCDTAALTEAENLGAIVETLMSQSKWVPGRNMSNFGLRQSARHLLLATRLAEVTQKARWITLRDKLINLWIASQDWDARGMYFVGSDQTDSVLGPGKFAAGIRIQSTFQIGVLAEAFYQAYRTTGRTELRDKLIAMARFIDRFGLDQQFQYTGSWWGVKADGTAFHNYNSGGTVTFWDPVYTTSLVNTLVMGSKFTGDAALYDRARYFFNRGTKGIFGSPTQRSAGDTVVAHFVDTVFDTSTSNFYLAFNKGELQYTYLLFEDGGR